MGKWALALFCAAIPLRAQEDPQELLLAASRRVLETVDRLPRYVCTLTIDRTQYQINGVSKTRGCSEMLAEKKGGSWQRSLYSTDRLRLDVAAGLSREAFGASGEMYSWVGEERFRDRGLFDIVRQGAISTGSFSGFLSSIFGGNIARFFYDGDREPKEKLLAQFGFSVPLEKSNLVYSDGDRRLQTRTAYDGTFLVNAASSDLTRLEIHQTMPPEADACEATQTLDYQRMRLGERDFLLPKDSRLTILGVSSEVENHAVFSACHEFVGQSTVSFEEPPQSAAPGRRMQETVLPAGLPFRLALSRPVDFRVAAAGDRIQATVVAAVRDRSGRTVLPRGAEVSARLVRVERFASPRSAVLGIRLDSVEIDGIAVPLTARSQSGVRRFQGTAGTRISLGPLDPFQDPDVGLFEFADAPLPQGQETNWVTR